MVCIGDKKAEILGGLLDFGTWTMDILNDVGLMSVIILMNEILF